MMVVLLVFREEEALSRLEEVVGTLFHLEVTGVVDYYSVVHAAHFVAFVVSLCPCCRSDQRFLPKAGTMRNVQHTRSVT